MSKAGCLLLVLNACAAWGMSDDIHVEQYRSPHVLKYDPGTHMTNNRPQEFHDFYGSNRPLSSSSRQESHQEQQFVDGKPVYERKYERRLRNGEVVFEDGYESGNPNARSDSYGQSSSSAGGGISHSYSSSSSSSSSGNLGNYQGTRGHLQDRLRSDVERLRQRLHQGSSYQRAQPSGSSYQEERNAESHFVNGQRVYGRRNERRFEDGQLVRNISEEQGSLDNLRSIHSNVDDVNQATYSNAFQAAHSSRSENSPSITTHRESYWRPQSTGRETNSNRIRTYQASRTGPQMIGSNSFNTPSSSSETMTSRHQSRSYNQGASYRPSNVSPDLDGNSRSQSRTYEYHEQSSNSVPVDGQSTGYSQYESNSYSNKPPGIQNTDEPVVVPTFSPGFIFDEDENSDGSDSRRADIDISQDTVSSSHSISESGSAVREANIDTRPGQTTDFSITLNLGEGDSVHLSQPNDVTSSGRFTSSNYSSSTNYESTGVGSVDRTYPTYSQNSRTNTVPYPSLVNNQRGPTYESVSASNRTSTISRIQPLISSYKMETRTSRRYLNGRLVSETKYNKFYENGMLVHENQTQRSRDEMETDGVNVVAFDLTQEDLSKYGLMEPENNHMSHSQRYEMTQEKEFVDGNQIYESTQSRRFQDGRLIHEEKSEKDRDELASINYVLPAFTNEAQSSLDRQSTSTSGSSISNRRPIITGNYQVPTHGSSAFETKFREESRTVSNNNLREGTRPTHFSGTGESVVVSVSPRTVTRKTEFRTEQEYKDGEQVYDLRHERRFEDGQLVDEDRVERGPEEFGTAPHRDALADVLSGRTFRTASQSSYQNRYPYNTRYPGGQSRTTIDSRSSSGDTTSASGNSYRNRNNNGQGFVGTDLLNSNSLTSVIGATGTHNYDTLHNAQALNEGSTTTNNRVPGGYYVTVGGSGAGYGGAQTSEDTGYQSSVSSGNPSGHSSSSSWQSSSSWSSSGGSPANSVSTNSDGSYPSVSAVDTRRSHGSGNAYSSSSGYGSSGSYNSDRDSSAHDNSGSTGRGSLSSYDSSSSYSASSGYGSGGSDGVRSGVGSGNSGLGGSYGSSSSWSSSSGYGGGGSYGSGRYGDGVSSRKEYEVEEHYENGRLVTGRREDKEWNNDNLIRHEEDHYGEGRGSPLSNVFRNDLTGACSSQPCHNGGSCISSHPGGYICTCPFGFKGRTCEEAYCPLRYCRHQGACDVTSGTHVCSCPSTHTGQRCERRTY